MRTIQLCDILAINGVELRAPDNIYRLLDGTANRQTVLTVNNQPTMDGRRVSTPQPFNPGRISTFGLLISDRQAGPFRLELETVAAYACELPPRP